MLDQPFDRSDESKRSPLQTALNQLADLRNISLAILRIEVASRCAESELRQLREQSPLEARAQAELKRVVRRERLALWQEFEKISDKSESTLLALYREMRRRDYQLAKLPDGIDDVLPNMSRRFLRLLLSIPGRAANTIVPTSFPAVTGLMPMRFNLADIVPAMNRVDPLLAGRVARCSISNESLEGLVVLPGRNPLAVVAWSESFIENAGPLELKLFWVTPTARRLGLGTALLEKMAEHAHRFGRSFIECAVERKIPGVRETLQRNGFRDVEPRREWSVSGSSTTRVLRVDPTVLLTPPRSSDIHPSILEYVLDPEMAIGLCDARRALIRVLAARDELRRVSIFSMQNLHRVEELETFESELSRNHLVLTSEFEGIKHNAVSLTSQLDRTVGKRRLRPEPARLVLSQLEKVFTSRSPQDVVSCLADGPRIDWRCRKSDILRQRDIMVRPLSEEDSDEIIDFDWDSAPRTARIDGSELEMARLDSQGVALVACEQERPVGVLHGFVSDRALHIKGVFVDTPWRRSGFGRALIQAAVAEATSRYCREIVISVSEVNTAMIALMKSSKCSGAKLLQGAGRNGRDLYKFYFTLTHRGL